MFCKNCGNKIEENQAFCTNCGVEIEKDTEDNLQILDGDLSDYKNNSKIHKKKIIIPTLIVLFVVLIIIIAILISNSAKTEVDDNSFNTSQMTENATQITKATTEEHKLSDDCTYILSAGYDNDDYYELVSNQIDGYPDSTFEVGVLKNNKWLVEMNKTSPFLEDNGWWKGLDSSYQQNIPPEDAFHYLGKGVFFFEASNDKIIYCPETNVVFKNLCNRDYTTIQNVEEFVGFEDHRIEDSASHIITFKCFNTKTGETKEIKGFFDDENIQGPNELYDVSDGLFFAKGETLTWSNFNYVEYCGFFDLDGNMIIDLSEYNITDYHDYMFKNGEYTITCKNNSDVKYNITFDNTGKIINETKVD